MAKQSNIFQWSIIDTDGDGEPLRAYPPFEIYNTGLLAGEPWARLWHNQMANNYSLWIQHLSGNSLDGAGVEDGGDEPVGSVRSYTNATDPNTLTSGTWVSIGTQTIGVETVTYWHKTLATPILPLP